MLLFLLALAVYSQYTCGGIAADADDFTAACSGNGLCMSQDNCVCFDCTGGPTCSTVVAGGATPYDANTCKGVNVTNECQCGPTHGLPNQFCPYCNHIQCNGIHQNHPFVCNNKGSCVLPGVCDCEEGYSGVWCENVELNYWVGLSDFDNVQTRLDHSVVIYEEYIYIYAGIDVDQYKTDTLFKYSPEEDLYTEISQGTTPPKRAAHSAVVYNDAMYVFGGRGEFGHLNDIWKYTFLTNTWTNLTLGVLPSIRFDHSAVVYNDRMYVFGGNSLNDFWFFDFGSGLWTQITLSGNYPPVSSEYHAAVYENKMYLTMATQTLWIYDFVLDTWTDVFIETSELIPFPESTQYSLSIIETELYIFGGSNPTNSNQLWKYDILLNEWVIIMSPPPLPSPRYGHGSVGFDGNMYVFAGEGTLVYNDAWVYKINFGCPECEEPPPCELTCDSQTEVCAYDDSLVQFCKCADGYHDVDGTCVELFECDSIYSNDPTVCNGNGVCTATDTCDCSDCYNGTYCDNFRGDCELCDDCPDCPECPPGEPYFVCEEEETWTCNEINNDDPFVCNGGGFCQPPGYCACLTYFFNFECSGITSGGGACFEHEDCSTNYGIFTQELTGECLGSCSCNSGYYGEYCDKYKCYGIDVNMEHVCSGHGDCVGLNQCECGSVYAGDDCEYWNCDSTANDASDVCSGHGDCVAFDTCDCYCNETHYYYGDNCENVTNTIQIGGGVEVPPCELPCDSQTEVCAYDDSLVQFCKCADGYHDVDGTCVELFVCGSIYSNDPTVCNGNGVCTATDICECSDCYGGEYCDTFNETCELCKNLLNVTQYCETVGVWSQVTSTGDDITRRYFVAMDVDSINHHVYFFGGTLGPYYNNLFRYDIITNVMTDITPVTSPPGRVHAKIVVDDVNQRIYMFGGERDTIVFYNDVWVYDISAGTWTDITSASPVKPPGRSNFGFLINIATQTLYLHGGTNTTVEFNDLWIFDVLTSSWTPLDSNTFTPSLAEGFGFVNDDVDLYRLGGREGSNFYNTFFKYDTTSGGWAIINPTGIPFTSRSDFVMEFDTTNGKQYVIGGQNEEGRVDGLWIYDTAENSWMVEDSPYPGNNPGSAYDQTLEKFFILTGQSSLGFNAEFGVWVYEQSEVCIDSSCLPACVNGDCIGVGICDCNTGWGGVACDKCEDGFFDDSGSCEEIFVCDGLNSYESTVCNGNGVCTATDTCDCAECYNGTYCDNFRGDCELCEGGGVEVPPCNLDCNPNGHCAYNDSLVQYCDCNAGYQGVDCDEPICDPECVQGTCAAPGDCNCTVGYTGDVCDKLVCEEHIFCGPNGDCAVNAADVAVCVCHFRYYGDYCQNQYILIDLDYCYGYSEIDHINVCSGNGDCQATDICDCDRGFSGLVCNETETCFGVDSDDHENVCSGHGDCVSQDTCVCDRGFSGTECETDDIYVCFDIPQSNNSVCGEHGDCIANDVCECERNYFGDECGVDVTPTCNGIRWDNQSHVCDGHGDCIYDPVMQTSQCVCDTNYKPYMDGCRIAMCNGVPVTEPWVCSGQGFCDPISEQCLCPLGVYTGEDCDVPVCGGKTNDDGDVCNNNGYCIGPNTCNCTDPSYGGLLCDDYSYGERPDFYCFGFHGRVAWFYDKKWSCGPYGVCYEPYTCLCDCMHYGETCNKTYRSRERKKYCRAKRRNKIFWWQDSHHND